MARSYTHEVVIIGGGAAGIATAASLLKRRPLLDIAIVEPSEHHYYQPGWTMVGGGVFDAPVTCRPMASVMPKRTRWIRQAAATFQPEDNQLTLRDGSTIAYRLLIVAPGIRLAWEQIEGLEQTLGRNGVTSNYRYDLAPYTWELVNKVRSGRAIFTQPPMPIKCAGAPQKAMYLSCDHWHRQGRLNNIDVEFYNAGAVLFGVADYVPALMKYIDKYQAKLNFGHTLTRIDGPAKTAWFATKDEQGNDVEVSREFDMIHVVPPQVAPDFIRNSPLVDGAGWVDVDQATLQHKKYANIWALGDVMNAPNAKTAAAARMQAPIVANNIAADISGRGGDIAHYNGYGSCPLTVERGKIVLAEFGYGGKLLPSFPKMMLDGTKPSRLAWLLKEKILPPIYWQGMLKGHEWLVKPTIGEDAPAKK